MTFGDDCFYLFFRASEVQIQVGVEIMCETIYSGELDVVVEWPRPKSLDVNV